MFTRILIVTLLILTGTAAESVTASGRGDAVPTGSVKDSKIQTNAALFPIRYDGTLTSPYEGLVFGNGDLAASAQILSQELTVRLGKNDVWDARISSLTKDAVLKHDDLLKSNGEGDGLQDNTLLTATDFVRRSKLGPTPKPVGFIRVRHPEQPPLERWERLFRMLGLNLGLLANPNTYGEAITKFQICLTERINRLVEDAHKLQLGLPFATEESVAALEMQVRTLKAAQERLEPLQALNTKARLQNLRLTDPELDELEQWLKVADSVHLLLGWVEEELRALDALGRYQAILEASPDFQTELAAAKTTVQDLCGEAGSLKKADLVPAMEAVQGALKTALVTYQMLKKKHCLDRGGDQRKRNLIQGKGMARLNKLVGVRVITLQSLEDLRSRVGTLPVYKGCTDEELLRSPTSLCPHTQFDPRSVTCDLPANEVLEQCVEGLERLEQDWTEQLLKELCDPALQASLEALKKGERKLVESFVQARALPEVVDDAFIKALNTALSGLHRRVVKADELAQALWGDHQPLKSDELQERFVRWLQQQIGSEAPETVRFVGEE